MPVEDEVQTTNDKLAARSTVDDVDRWTCTTDGGKAVTILPLSGRLAR
ncbi:hypothetical protein ACLMAL_32300 [Nocardia sp. CWNU-33]